MLFNSFSFFLFLPIVFVLYHFLPVRFRIWILLFASYYFYMSWNVKYVLLILFTTFVTYFAALLMEKVSDRGKKKLYLTCAILTSFALLFFFKYFDFTLQLLEDAARAAGIKLHKTTLDLLLPVGISFYTFQTVSYLVDVYKERVRAERDLVCFATFISFFPQLVAGPIERTENLLPQLKNLPDFDEKKASYGLKLMAWGLFKKMIIADSIAPGVDHVYGNISVMDGATLFAATFLFAIQIYCDFSGYSDIAIGTGKLFGIDLMQNFRIPYLASSFRDFWARWHISLSTWFRDYLYIPLGGNRKGKLRQYINLFITFAASGLWHGANLTFLVWGIFHGLLLIIENILWNGKRKENIEKSSPSYKFFAIVFVFFFISLAWIFFRAQSISDSFQILKKIFTSLTLPVSSMQKLISVHGHIGYPSSEWIKIIMCIFLLFIYDLASFLYGDILEKSHYCPKVLRWSLYVLLGLMLLFFQPLKVGTSFIYFQF